MVKDWLHLGLANEAAATELLKGAHYRSAVSRFYYAAYSATHALLLVIGQTAPMRGNWGHEGLPEHLETSMGNTRDAGWYAKRLGELYDLRIDADYGPLRSVDERAAVRARQLAGPLLRLAERRITL